MVKLMTTAKHKKKSNVKKYSNKNKNTKNKKITKQKKHYKRKKYSRKMKGGKVCFNSGTNAGRCLKVVGKYGDATMANKTTIINKNNNVLNLKPVVSTTNSENVDVAAGIRGTDAAAKNVEKNNTPTRINLFGRNKNIPSNIIINNKVASTNQPVQSVDDNNISIKAGNENVGMLLKSPYVNDIVTDNTRHGSENIDKNSPPPRRQPPPPPRQPPPPGQPPGQPPSTSNDVNTNNNKPTMFARLITDVINNNQVVNNNTKRSHNISRLNIQNKPTKEKFIYRDKYPQAAESRLMTD